MAALTIEQSVFLKTYIQSKLQAGDPHSEDLLEIFEQLSKSSYDENVKEDIFLALESYNDNLAEGLEPLFLSEKQFNEVLHDTKNYDHSDYNDYIQELLLKYRK